MNPLSKLSLILLALGFLAAPFFASAALPFFGGGSEGDGVRFPSLRATLGDFSLKNLDERLYSFLKNKKSAQMAAVVILGSPTPPQCDDKADNDGDGTMDMGVWVIVGYGDEPEYEYVPPDPDCSSLDDTSEGKTACSDSLDNDGDGAIDMGVTTWCVSDGGGGWDCTEFPADPECADYSDNNESPVFLPGGILTFPGGPCPLLTCGLGGGGTPTYNLDVTLPGDNDIIGNAYATTHSINWSVKDGCGCFSSPGSWWSGTTGAGTVSGIQNMTIDTPGSATYTLTCNKYPSCTAAAGQDSDSVTITPLWSPSVALSGPASVTAGQTVYLNYSATDIKSCVKSWDGGTLILSGGNPQTGTLSAGTISAPTRFTLTCTGFGNNSYQASAVVGFISGPTPYFFINSINLIIIGPGSGGRSNKATIGVTPGGGFTGTINLSAANAALTSAGAVLHVEPSTITCDGVSCTTAEFWVETASDLAEAVYNITLTADPIPSGFESKTQDIPLRVRRFVPAFEEI